MISTLIAFYFGFNLATTLFVNYGEPESTALNWALDLLFGLPIVLHSLISSKL